MLPGINYSVGIQKNIQKPIYVIYPDGHRGCSKRKLHRNGNHQKSAQSKKYVGRHVGRCVPRSSWLTSLIITEELNTRTTTLTAV